MSPLALHHYVPFIVFYHRNEIVLQQYFRFDKIEVRNHGSLIISNEKTVRTFVGKTLRVLGGGKISATHLEVQLKNMTIDSLGVIEASKNTHPNLGRGW